MQYSGITELVNVMLLSHRLVYCLFQMLRGIFSITHIL